MYLLDCFTTSAAQMDTTRQARLDPMHNIARNAQMVWGVVLDVGAWEFTQKRRNAECTLGTRLLSGACSTVVAICCREICGAARDRGGRYPEGPVAGHTSWARRRLPSGT